MFVKEDYYDYDKRFISSTKFLLANGYYGYRGNLSEDKAEDMVAWNLNGVYDQVGENWRESINAFNPLFTLIEYQNHPLHPKDTFYKEHQLALNLDNGVLTRKTVFTLADVEIEISSRRFANQTKLNCLHEEYTFKANKAITIILYQGIDLEINDISGKHLEKISCEVTDKTLIATGFSQELNLPVTVASSVTNNFSSSYKTLKSSDSILRKYILELIPNKIYKLWINSGVMHSEPKQSDRLNEVLNYYRSKDFSEILEENSQFWQEKWKKGKIDIIGHDEANLALNYDIFQLISHRPYSHTVSIPARGLSGQVYKGAVFWDTEIYMFLFYLLTDIASAKNILYYRINGLKEAISKANSYGYAGAFYAWESQEDGFDACSDYNLTDPLTKKPIRTYFKELQVHINGAIIYALDQYIIKSGDYSILKSGGMEMLLEINSFYIDYLTMNPQGKYECLNVIGPDEYHEHVNNNAYTNYLIKFCLDKHNEYLNYLEIHSYDYYVSLTNKYFALLEKSNNVIDNLFLPKPNKSGIIPQFDGYLDLEDVELSELLSKKGSKNEYLGGKDGLATKTQIIKQADVILLLVLFPKLFSEDIQRKNYNYYKTRTEHGSSLSKAVYSILASRLGYTKETFDYFLTGANIDLTGNSKQFAGGIYIGGSHLAAYGGAYMACVLGFLDYDLKSGLTKPHYPKEIKAIKTNL
jgi:trehalose/maltose hydrolase-like predicted phosphorylase